MATLPLAFECTFEDGTLGAFDSETDTQSKLGVQHYSYLGRFPFPDYIPYKGAYAALIDLSVGTADAYYQENTGFDTALAGAVAMRMYFCANQLTMAALDRFTIATLQSGAGTDEATVSVYSPSAGNYQFVAAETGAIAIGANTRAADLIQGKYHCIELVCTIDSGGADGTIAFLLDGFQVGAAITGLTQAAITQARFGAIGIDAGTTRGLLLYDDITGDTTRVGPLARRFNQARYLTQSGHAVIGPANIIAVDILQSAAFDETLVMYDTDTADTTDLSKRVVVFGEFVPFYVSRGLYCVLAGTNPFASVKVHDACDMSIGNVKRLANRRAVAA